MKHTKRPWKVYITSSDNAGNTYLQVISKKCEINSNINLISAAPEMLEILKYITKNIPNHLGEDNLSRIEKVINKAEGK